MTQEELETEDALRNAEQNFLQARGWQLSRSVLTSGIRCTHPSLTLLPSVGIRDALELTRAEARRYRKPGL